MTRTLYESAYHIIEAVDEDEAEREVQELLNAGDTFDWRCDEINNEEITSVREL